MSSSQKRATCRDTTGRRLLRGLCSSFVPGSGQLVGGARRRGYALLSVVGAALVALVVVIVLTMMYPDEVSAWLLEPSLLLWLLVADLVLLLFRLYAVTDAVWMRQRRSPARDAAAGGSAGGGAAGPAAGGRSRRRAIWHLPVTLLGFVLLLAFTALPQVWVGYQYVYKSYDMLNTVFVSSPPADTADTTATTETLAYSAGDDQRLTILFTGCDAGVGREGARADTNIVASFDLKTGRIALFSIPRNTGNAPLTAAAQKALRVKVWPDWINGLYDAARQHPELAPQGGDPGATTMRDTLSIILGIDIDYYAVVDMAGFVELVEAMGGVDIYVDKRLHASISPPTEEEETLVYNFQKGWNHLDGRMALAYSRTRAESSDYTRMGRQRCVIAGLIDQTTMGEIIWDFPTIVSVIKTAVRTDIPIDALQQLVRLRPTLKTDQMITIAFQKPKYTNGVNSNPIQLGWILDYKLIQSTVQRVLEHPDEVLAEADKTGLDDGACWQGPPKQ